MVDAMPRDVGKHGVQRDQVAVDVGDEGDTRSHSALRQLPSGRIRTLFEVSVGIQLIKHS